LTNLELAQKIAELMGKELKYELVDFHKDRPGHDIHYGLDGTKLKSLGWSAPVDFETSLKETIKWQQEHPEWI
jgi:dTDP-glucose 4,6-dehydratase